MLEDGARVTVENIIVESGILPGGHFDHEFGEVILGHQTILLST